MKLHVTLYRNEVEDILIAHLSRQLNMPESQIKVSGCLPSDTTIIIDTESKPTNNEDEDEDMRL